MKHIFAGLVIIALVGIAFATPLDAVKSVGDVNRGIVDVVNLNSSVFKDPSFGDDIGNSSAYNGSTTDVAHAWETSIKEWMNSTEF